MNEAYLLNSLKECERKLRSALTVTFTMIGAYHGFERALVKEKQRDGTA
jgi:hypothetical protein